MSKRYPNNTSPVVSQGSYSLQVANLERPSLNAEPPVKLRSEFTFNPMMALGGDSVVLGADMGLRISDADPTSSTGSFDVTDNDFSQGAALILGPFRFQSGVDFEVGASVNDTAANMAAVIDAKAHWSAVAAGASVTIAGPFGSVPYEFRVESYGSVLNFTITLSEGGFLVPGQPDASASVISG